MNKLIVVFEGVPTIKIKYLLKDLGLSDSVRYFSDDSLLNTHFQSLSKLPGKRSVLLKIIGSGIAYFTPVSELGIDENLEKIINSGNEINLLKTKAPIAGDTLFYSDISDALICGGFGYVLTESPSRVIVFDTLTKTLLRSLTLNDSIIRTTIFKTFIADLADSLVRKNSLDTVLYKYHKHVEPLGLPIFTFNNIAEAKGKIYLSCYVSLPITTAANDISFMGKGYILIYDTNLRLLEARRYDFTTYPKSAALSIYGFRVTDDDGFNMACVDYDLKLRETNFFQGHWIYKNGKYSNMGVDTINTIPKSAFEKYFAKNKELAFKHRYADSTFSYFVYSPVVFSFAAHKYYSILPNDPKTPFYTNYYMFRSQRHKEVYLFAIEKIGQQVYLTKFNSEMQREKMNPIKLDKGSTCHFQYSNGSLNIVYFNKSEGLGIATYNLARIEYW